jgi:hypothetical protein
MTAIDLRVGNRKKGVLISLWPGFPYVEAASSEGWVSAEIDVSNGPWSYVDSGHFPDLVPSAGIGPATPGLGNVVQGSFVRS